MLENVSKGEKIDETVRCQRTVLSGTSCDASMMSKEAYYEIVVDNLTSKENVTRYAEHQGYQVSVREEAGEYVLTMKKKV